jgi:peptidoglycan/LPS O-acetylase OafA/YrhL
VWTLSAQLGPAEGPTSSDILYNALLLPTDGEPLLTIAWTLQHEMLFYGMFGLAILSRPIGLGLVAAWFAACAFSLISAASPAFPLSFVLSAYNLIFLFGIGAALAYPYLSTRAAWMVFIVGLMGFAATGLADVYGYWPLSHDWRTCAFGVSAGLIIAGVAALEISGKLKASKSLTLLGDSSYSLYLIHMPAMLALIPVYRAMGLHDIIPLPVTTVILLIACVIAGLILHISVERPLISLIRSERRAPAMAQTD